ncbi:S41 family peptidase [Borrelia miyamotoi]|uniref:S41 family peptidase n=1 Tax=Borrelia miyamotoi TaxID=47466 RepID=A0AAQ2X0T7_9SPIR|nr:S41 family peptidase [Borrelia miyamotoi]AGT27349.1 peptidase S41 [Borrelia miyamotoi LB-2001]AJA58529.1 peptidase S41 [Borrelia miyamotoi]AOW95606.1 peptidase S41 [Borrelia miyamotoi]QTL83491.1 S41 family peptidase [Borrelia miyamotoi]WAZ85214.1 S41 family peptidase [Borrelia miyamotoi]
MKKKFLIFVYFVLILSISSSVIVESIFAQANSSNIKMSEEGYSQMMLEAFKFIKRNYVEHVDEEALLEGALKGMFNSLNDPYSQYLTRKDLLDISKTTQGNYVGIGISITKKDVSLNSGNSIASYIMVVSLFEDGPAYKAGIKAGDYITAIDGKSTALMTIEKFIELLGGEVGTKVKVSVLRDKDSNLEFEVIRSKVDINTVKHDVINKDVGYIKILSFNPNTNMNFRKAFENLQTQNIKSLILDLRLNAGGYLQDAIKIADDILSEGIIVSTKSRDASVPMHYKASSSYIVPLDMKIVILIDRYSASASEVLVGALKDNHRVYVIGEKSYGKGVIQRILPFYTGGFKITNSKYYTPSGSSIHNVGIKPDLEIEKLEYSEDDLLAYRQIFDKNLVENFLKSKRNKRSITEDEIDSFVDNAIKKHSSHKEIDKDFLGHHLLLQFYHHTDNEMPIYNLRYDKALRAAYEYLLKGTKN